MLEDLIRDRKRKLEAYGEEAAYPARVPRTMNIGEALERFAALVRAKKKISLAGRLMSVRDQGKLIFADLRDGSGQIQIVLKRDDIKDFVRLRSAIDAGDFLSVTGTLMKTARGEKSLAAKTAVLAAKALRAVPKEWFGIENEETRLRKRYLESILDPELRGLFEKKSRFWGTVREFLTQEGFLDVETPVLEGVPGGAEAEPFVTHHNALDRDFYLRISLELPLKKMLVGGFEKVFEIGRIFRNEGIDREHLQDYTQMECYFAYADYNAMMALMEKLYKKLVKTVTGSLKTKSGGTVIDWGKKWPKYGYFELFKKHAGLDLGTATAEDLKRKARELKIEFDHSTGRGRLIDLIYKKTVRPKLVQPCFLIDPPVDIEPLAKRVPGHPERVERFQIMAAGTELGKGFSELNDPVDQRQRFAEQAKLRASGDKEAQMTSEDFLEALEYGMPPAAGFGMSERVFAVMMDKPVREAVYFPLMREDK
ncbi:lysine--tRNA ligase [Patescibacteria group bacterium]|nr:lysine--tRNA ligase [Patescibacteria group bacterium]